MQKLRPHFIDIRLRMAFLKPGIELDTAVQILGLVGTQGRDWDGSLVSGFSKAWFLGDNDSRKSSGTMQGKVFSAAEPRISLEPPQLLITYRGSFNAGKDVVSHLESARLYKGGQAHRSRPGQQNRTNHTSIADPTVETVPEEKTLVVSCVRRSLLLT